MMKNNKVKYLLLTGVLLIWGLVAKMIFFSEEVESDSFKPVAIEKAIRVNENAVDSFELLANYTDPFLGKIKSKTKKVRSSSSNKRLNRKHKRKHKTKEKKKQEEQLKWPDVDYLGVVQHTKSDDKLYILRVGKREELVKVGESLSGVSILQFESDSIVLEYKGNQKRIPNKPVS